MKSSLFVPDKINVGFQDRSGTYTGKLAYVIYFDQKGKLRKEVSWNSWRDLKIDNVITENVPTSGFVLNKKAGDYKYDWNHRQAYARVYDPRGFEFEITIDNLLFILECCDMFKGKGIDGELVYAWDGKDLVLLPVNSPDYAEIIAYNKILKEDKVIKSKDLKPGYKYIDKDDKEWIYLGRFHKYDRYDGTKKKSKYYYFAKEFQNWTTKKPDWGIETVSSLGQKFIRESSDGCVENFDDLMEMLEGDREYSPIDFSKDEFVPLTYEEFLTALNDSKNNSARFYSPVKQKPIELYYNDYYSRDNRVTVERGMVKKPKKESKFHYYSSDYEWVQDRNEDDRPLFAVSNGGTQDHYYSRYNNYKEYFRGTLEEVFEYLKPSIRRVHLANGKLYSVDK
ncbi:UNVERIFIED_ORG: hypothetical protein Xoosp15_190 [Xanthomonas phage Xoo-sp15]